mgnify:CR=1 FL=1
MDFKAIQDILKYVNKSNLVEVEIEDKDFRLRIKRKASEVYVQPQAPVVQQPVAPQPEATAPQPAPTTGGVEKPAPQAGEQPAEGEAIPANAVEVKSPMIGTFYRKPSPDKEPYVKVGDTVSKGQTLCIIEAMKLFNEIEAELDGKILKVLVEDEKPVEYDQPLFLIEPAG